MRTTYHPSILHSSGRKSCTSILLTRILFTDVQRNETTLVLLINFNRPSIVHFVSPSDQTMYSRFNPDSSFMNGVLFCYLNIYSNLTLGYFLNSYGWCPELLHIHLSNLLVDPFLFLFILHKPSRAFFSCLETFCVSLYEVLLVCRFLFKSLLQTAQLYLYIS